MAKQAERPVTGWYDVTNIAPHKENYRHKPVAADKDAMRELLSDEKKHGVFELAEDMVDLGRMDPSSRLLICADSDNVGHYIALEGNRRITALKTLFTPEIAEGLPVYNKFKKLSKEFLKAPIVEVECAEVSPEEARIWIRRKHYKGQGGKGVKEWDPMQRARSDAEDGGVYAPWLAATDYLRSKGLETDYLLDGIDAKSTTVDRVFSSKHMEGLLGVTFSKSGAIAFENKDEDKGAELLLAMLEEMIKPEFKVTLVENADDIENYLQRFLDLSVKQVANDPGSSGGEDSGAGAPGDSPFAEGSKTKTSKAPKKKERKGLAEKGLNISHTQLNNFYCELVKLPIKTYMYSASAMIRIFLEKATMVFLEEMDIKHPDGLDWDAPNSRLKDKLKAALNELDPKSKNKSLQPVRQLTYKNPDKSALHNTNILNDYIHNHRALPDVSEIRTIWDRFHPYYEALFEAIENKHD